MEILACFSGLKALQQPLPSVWLTLRLSPSSHTCLLNLPIAVQLLFSFNLISETLRPLGLNWSLAYRSESCFTLALSNQVPHLTVEPGARRRLHFFLFLISTFCAVPLLLCAKRLLHNPFLLPHSLCSYLSASPLSRHLMEISSI